jgi:predicted unusual protein kinase regulating ubiquinone biosynthesis (AarF/ABC1/UbiB family)
MPRVCQRPPKAFFFPLSRTQSGTLRSTTVRMTANTGCDTVGTSHRTRSVLQNAGRFTIPSVVLFLSLLLLGCDLICRLPVLTDAKVFPRLHRSFVFHADFGSTADVRSFIDRVPRGGAAERFVHQTEDSVKPVKATVTLDSTSQTVTATSIVTTSTIAANDTHSSSNSNCNASSTATTVQHESETNSDTNPTTVQTVETSLTVAPASAQSTEQEAALAKDRAAEERALFVRSTLARRRDYVESGKRMKDFGKWVQARDGDPTVFSMHGVDAANAAEFDQDTRVIPERRERLSKDPFASDRLNLELVVLRDCPPNQYFGKSLHLSDTTSPSTFRLILRAMRLGIAFAPVLSTVGLAVISPRFRNNVWYSWLTTCIGQSGAAWIKWGQWSSTRNDMFPDAFCEQLATLHAAAPAHKWKFSEQTLESSLGIAPGSLLQVFDEIDPVPLASGSIAQIHKAVLDGKSMAVKIRHPNVAALIDMDFRLMKAAAILLDAIPALSWLRIRESVEQFSHTMAAQAYLHVEAHHLEVLNYNFRSWPHVRFPHPFYASSAVIMETFEQGQICTEIFDMYDDVATHMNDGTAVSTEGKVTVEEAAEDAVSQTTNSNNVGANTSTPESTGKGRMISTKALQVQGHELIPLKMAQFLVTNGVALYLKMLLVDNLMHADLHPGNIMVDCHCDSYEQAHKREQIAMVPVMSDPNQKLGKFRIALVDAGMVAQLTDKESSTFIGLLASLGEGDGQQAAEFALQFSLENHMNETQRSAFTEDMVTMFAERCRGYGTGVDVGYVLRGVLGLIRDHKVRIDANFATLVVNCLCIESLAARVCPSYNVLDAARPLLQTYRAMCYEKDGTPKPQARNSSWVKFVLSLQYQKKNSYDRAFFAREANAKRRKHIQEKVL